MKFDTPKGGTCRMEFQQSFADRWREVNADRTHIADDLQGGFLECEI
jgi:hypothetical protein